MNGAPGSTASTVGAGPRYSPALDGLRAISALAVLGLHLSYGHFPGGFLGVDVFFALSGYLITRILYQEHEALGRVRLGRFYVRRARRLLPALLVGLALAWALWPSFAPRFLSAAIPTLFYYANWTSVFRGPESLGTLAPAWSLAIEEQFYLVWPVTFLLITRSVQSRKVAGKVTLAVVVVLALSRAALHLASSPLAEYESTLARIDEILIGGAIALWSPRISTWRPVAWICAAAMLGAGSFARETSAWLYLGGFSIFALFAAMFVDAIVRDPAHPIAQALTFGPLVAVGRRSYGVYLFHLPIVIAFEPLRVPHSLWNFLWVSVLRVASTLAVAWLSYRLVEVPALGTCFAADKVR